MRYRAVIAYNGARYVGWQRQLNGVSVQEQTEKALEALFGVPTVCTASGRTDAGVHAEGQVIHFDAETSIPTNKIPYAVNTELPADISMLSCEVAPEGFHARFGAKRKTYCYKLYYSPHRLPSLDSTHAHTIVAPNVEMMKQAALLIEGEHDFKCFEASGSVIKNTVRTVYSLDVQQKGLSCSACTPTPYEILITVCGNGFLYNMVRIIAGTLLYVGIGKLTLSDVEKILSCKDRTKAGKTLPAKGLHLISVEYES